MSILIEEMKQLQKDSNSALIDNIVTVLNKELQNYPSINSIKSICWDHSGRNCSYIKLVITHINEIQTPFSFTEGDLMSENDKMKIFLMEINMNIKELVNLLNFIFKAARATDSFLMSNALDHYQNNMINT